MSEQAVDGTRATHTRNAVASSPDADAHSGDIVRWDERVVLDLPLCDAPRETVRELEIGVCVCVCVWFDSKFRKIVCS